MNRLNVKKIYWISAYTALISGGLAVLSFLISNVILHTYQSNITRKVYDFEPVNYVEINALNVDVEVSCWKGEKVEISYKCDSPPEIETTGSKISLTQEDRFVITLFAADKLDFKIEVKLPEYKYKRLLVTTNSGNIRVSDIPAEVVNLSARSGNIVAKGIRSQLVLENEKGNSTVEFSHLDDDVLLETDSGDVDVLLPKKAEYKLDFKTECGRIVSDREKKPLLEDTTKTYGQNPRKFTVSTVSGVVRINTST